MALEIKTETSLDAAMQSDNISTIIKNESHCGDPQQEQFVYPVKTELQECEQIVTPEEVLYFTQAVKEERYPINEDSEVKEEMDFEEHEPLNTSGRRYLQNVKDEDEIVLQTVDLKTEEPEPSEVKPDVSGPSTVNRSCNAGSSTQTRIRCGTVCSYNMKLKERIIEQKSQLRIAKLKQSIKYQEELHNIRMKKVQAELDLVRLKLQLLKYKKI